eukprot:SAG11_NODE_7490_length_1137_cov_1.727360_1_plen_84_part_00
MMEQVVEGAQYRPLEQAAYEQICKLVGAEPKAGLSRAQLLDFYGLPFAVCGAPTLGPPAATAPRCAEFAAGTEPGRTRLPFSR